MYPLLTIVNDVILKNEKADTNVLINFINKAVIVLTNELQYTYDNSIDTIA